VIKEGYHSEAKDWGKYTAKKVAMLRQPVECHSKIKGKALFNPTIVKLEWESPPSDDKHGLWFPYWITWSDISDKERYGQFAPMIGEKALLELLGTAINQEFFSRDFLTGLNGIISAKLNSR
jgi:hypothetical protein